MQTPRDITELPRYLTPSGFDGFAIDEQDAIVAAAMQAADEDPKTAAEHITELLETEQAEALQEAAPLPPRRATGNHERGFTRLVSGRKRTIGRAP